jgi:hypothetical protein
MASIRRERYKPRKIFLYLKLKVYQYSKKNKSDLSLKIITFIVFLIQHVTDIKIMEIIRKADACGLFKIYTDMINDESVADIKNELISNLSFLSEHYKKNVIKKIEYANQLATTTNEILKTYHKNLDIDDLTILLGDLIALIYINSLTFTFSYKATKNLEDDHKYNQKLECTSVTLDLINRIRLTLMRLFPGNMDLLMVLVNTLLNKLY